MRLLMHFMAADARRFRLTIALWTTVAVVHAALLHAAMFVPPETRRAETIQMVAFLVWLAGVLLSAALVPLIMQLHPAVGSDAFWMTRPLPRWTLVASKLALLVLLIVLVPVAIEQTVMAVHRMPPGDMLRVAMQTTLVRGVLLAGLAAAAALTPNFARFTLLCGAALLAFAVLPIILMLIDAVYAPGNATLSAFLSSENGISVPFPVADTTALIAGTILLLAGGVVTVGVQYGTRHTGASIVAIVSAFAAALVVSSRWPWEVIVAEVRAPAWAESSSALVLSADPAAVRLEATPAWQEGAPRWFARAPARMSPAAPGWMARSRLIRVSFDLGNDVRLSSESHGSTAALPDREGRQPAQVALQHALGVQRVALWGTSLVRGVAAEDPGISLQMPADVLARAKAPTGTFRGEFLVDLARVDIAATLPLRAGAEYRDGAYRMTIDDVRLTDGGVMLRGRTTIVATIFDARPRPTYSYFLRNSQRSEALGGSAPWRPDALSLPLIGGLHISAGGPTGFSAHAQMVSFPRNFAQREQQFVVDRQWLDEAELVIVRATHQGSVPRTLEIRDFPLTAARSGS